MTREGTIYLDGLRGNTEVSRGVFLADLLAYWNKQNKFGEMMRRKFIFGRKNEWAELMMIYYCSMMDHRW